MVESPRPAAPPQADRRGAATVKQSANRTIQAAGPAGADRRFASRARHFRRIPDRTGAGFVRRRKYRRCRPGDRGDFDLRAGTGRFRRQRILVWYDSSPSLSPSLPSSQLSWSAAECGDSLYYRRMRYRQFGRTGWSVSEVGYGMWGMAGWTGSDDEESFESLDRAIELGCNFFDTAWAYGDGHSERLLGADAEAPSRQAPLRRHQDPAEEPQVAGPSRVHARRRLPRRLHPRVHREEPREHRRRHARPPAVSRLERHVGGRRALAAGVRRAQGTEGSCGRSGSASIAGSRPTCCKALETGLIDAVQVVYNVFDQNPEDELFPACQEQDIAVIARVPFDEGSLTGTLTADSTWPEGDFRNLYFNPENLRNDPAARRAAPAGGSGGHDDAAAGAAAHPSIRRCRR